MASEPILSVIIPVYRTEAYLRECLASVARQTLEKIEVIIVNDGSPDESQRIINAYCFVFDYFSSIQTEHHGKSAARNTALERARGKYVTFLDSDDRVPEDAYEALVTAAGATTADVCVGVAQSFNSERAWLNPQMQELYDCVASHATLDDLLPLVRDASPSNKIFLRELVRREELRFPAGINLREDLHFVLRALAAAHSITVLPATVYHCRSRQDSEDLSNTEEVHPKVFEDLLWVSRDLDTLLRDRVSERVWREKYTALLGYISYSLFKFVRAYEVDEEEQTLGALRDYLVELPEGLIDQTQNPKDRLLLQLTAAGQYVRLRELAKEQADKRRQATKSLRKRLKGLRHKTVARAQDALKGYAQAPYSIASEAKLALATGRKHLHTGKAAQGDIWVVGERRGLSAEDTGFAFFRHLRTTHPELKAYFVTKADSKGAREAEELGNVLRYGSTEACEMLLRARVLAYSDNGQDLFHRWKRLARRLRRDVVGCFLQHGVIGLSATGDFYSKRAMVARKEHIDLFVTSSPSERAYVTRNLGFREDEVVVTGLSRFDALSANSTSEREILYMPTWRQWLRYGNQDDYQRSQYFLTVQALLSDRRLHNLLEEYDYRLTFVGHFAMAKLADAFRCSDSRVQIVGPEGESVQHYVTRAKLLITDYSSVSYDFAYQRRPVLFYQFDAERFYRSRGVMVIDPTTEMLGDVVRSQDEVIDYIRDWLASEQTMLPKYRERADSFFPPADCNNSERIYQALLACQRSKSI